MLHVAVEGLTLWWEVVLSLLSLCVGVLVSPLLLLSSYFHLGASRPPAACTCPTNPDRSVTHSPECTLLALGAAGDDVARDETRPASATAAAPASSSLLAYFYSTAVTCFPDVSWALSRKHTRGDIPYASIAEKVLASDAVQQAIGFTTVRTVDDGRVTTSRLLNQKRAKLAQEIFESMAARPRMPVIRFLSVFLRKAFRLLYQFGIHIDDAEIQRIREAQARGPVLFLPTHKSHVDYLVMQMMCFARELHMPVVVAGDNLNIPIIGRVLKWGGALFIRRSFSGDTDRLYGVLFSEYIKQLLAHGISIECFIEGGRSRSGKVLPPKIGVLHRVVDAVLDGMVADTAIVPVSIAYDRLVENESHVEELTGGKKRKERLIPAMRSLSSLLASSFFQVNTYGRVDIRIAQPFSIAEYLETVRSADPSIKLHKDRVRKYLAYSLGYSTLYQCNRISVVEPSALVATVLLTHYQRGISKHDLVRDVMWLGNEIKLRGGSVVDIDIAGVEMVVEYVLKGITGENKLVKKYKDRYMVSLYSPKERMELGSFRNQLIHHFVDEALICLAFYMCEKESTTPSFSAGREVLLTHSTFLSKMLKLEFIYRPSLGEATMQKNFTRTVEAMLERGIFVECDDGSLSVNDALIPGTDNKGTQVYLFLCALFWHFIDSYWLGCLGLFTLLPSRVSSEEALLRRVQEVGETLYFDGQLDLYEAIAKDTLHNAWTLLESWGVIEFIRIEGEGGSYTPGKRTVRLQASFQSEAAIQRLVVEVGRYRKRSRAYRSRRYANKCTTDVDDAIHIMKETLGSELHMPARGPTNFLLSKPVLEPEDGGLGHPSTPVLRRARELGSSRAEMARLPLDSADSLPEVLRGARGCAANGTASPSSSPDSDSPVAAAFATDVTLR